MSSAISAQLPKELYCCASVVFRTQLDFLALCGHSDVPLTSTSVDVRVRSVQTGQCVSSWSDSSFSRPFARFTGDECVSHEQDDAYTSDADAYAVKFWYAESNQSFCEWILGNSSLPRRYVTRSGDHGGGGIWLRRLLLPDLCGTWIDPHHHELDGRKSRRHITSAFDEWSFSGTAKYSADEQFCLNVSGTAVPLIPWTFFGTFKSSSMQAPVVFDKVTHGRDAVYWVEVWLIADAKYLLWYRQGKPTRPENIWTWESDGKCDVRCANGRCDCGACTDEWLRSGKDKDVVTADRCRWVKTGKRTTLCVPQSRLQVQNTQRNRPL